jgi:hypothetical protein
MRFRALLTPVRHLHLAEVFWRVCADLERIVLRHAYVPTYPRISHFLLATAAKARKVAYL